MRRTVLLATVAMAILGCTKVDEGNPIEWKSLALVGKTLTLIDEKAVQIFPFAEDGIAASTIGIKDKALAGPILYWKIQGNVLVISEAPDSNVYEELSYPSLKAGVVSATRKSGARAQYALAKSDA